MKNLENFLSLSDKVQAFSSWDNVSEYAENFDDIVSLFGQLSNEEKYEVLRRRYLKDSLDTTQRKILIKQMPPVFQMRFLKQEDISDFFSLENVIMHFPGNLKDEFIRSKEVRAKVNDETSLITKVILSKPKNEIISYLTGDILTDDEKLKVVCELDLKAKINIIENESAARSIFKKSEFTNGSRITIIMTFSVDELIQYLRDDNEFLKNSEIDYRYIWKYMEDSKLMEVAERIEEFSMDESKKVDFFVHLRDGTKSMIDEEKINLKYRKILGMRTNKYAKSFGRLYPELSKDLEEYRGLDEQIYVNLFQLLEDGTYDIEKLKKLCEICPNIEIDTNNDLWTSNVEEFIQAEEWFSSILEGVQEDWTDIQKLAYIDYSIGASLTYTPEFDTESWEGNEELQYKAKSMNTVVTERNGVCIGIATVEAYLLKRLGIDCTLIHAQKHTYIKVNGIDIPTKDGIVKGNTLVDPTWNLIAGRYKFRPNYFGKSYEEMRKADGNGFFDRRCHESPQLEGEEFVSIGDEQLKEIFASIGFVREDGFFGGKELFDMIEEADEKSNDVVESIEARIEAVKKYCPEYATCIDATSDVMRALAFKEKGKLKYNTCIINKVYKKDDSKKSANLFVYFKLEDGRKVFYLADRASGDIVKMNQKEFEQQYDCYELDKEKNNGKCFWYDKEKEAMDATDAHEEL